MTEKNFKRLKELTDAYDAVAELTYDDTTIIDFINTLADSEDPEGVFEHFFGYDVKELNKELTEYGYTEV